MATGPPSKSDAAKGISPSPLIQLLAALPAKPIFTRDRSLYVGNERLEPQNVLAAAVASSSQDRQLLALTFSVKRSVLPKRITAVAIDDTLEHVVVSDAVGDVYRLPLDKSLDFKNDDAQHDFLLLGHFSTITDISLTPDFIATADRDNKIRVSRYPCSYVIESFCLSHTQFITALKWTLMPNNLLSAGGDSTIRLWDGAKGQQLDCLRLSESDVIQKSLKHAHEPLVMKFATHPLNKDVVLFALHNCDAVFTLFGLCEARLSVALAYSFGGNIVSGLSTCKKALAYVSLQDAACVMQASLNSAAEAACRPLTFTAQKHVTAANDEAGRELSEQEQNDLLRFNWLARQRKKDMVHNWKGKKRRHVEI
ncbi:WD40/YVTN repeat-like containing protein [Gracilaria domingensis]|nr:WD40/YVTN repeat-like containing protein [Gracilaria domingensis]